MKVLLNMLDDLIAHYKKTENNSLLARIYGVFTIKTNVFKSVDVIVMQNIIKLADKTNPCMSFDLKGSLKGRYTNFGIKDCNWWQRNIHGHKKIMKDKNFIQIDNDYLGTLLNFDENQKIKLRQIIIDDSNFLKMHNLIDYSLMLVIETLIKESPIK